jgi:hypothetical protein
MGARNAVAAYQRWAGRVPGNSMQVLVYMALVAKDSDDWPWYGQGQAALAEMAIGRENPDRSDLRAVSRAMQPLLDAGAVTVDRAGAARGDGGTTARYRLNLHERADAERRKWEETHDGKRRTSDARRGPRHTTKTGNDIRRFPTQHTTVSDATYDGNRRTKEKEKIKRSEKTEEEAVDLPAAVTLAREPEADENPSVVVEMFPGAAQEARYRPPPRWTSRTQDAIAEAQANIAARKAARAAQQPPAGTEVS